MQRKLSMPFFHISLLHLICPIHKSVFALQFFAYLLSSLLHFSNISKLSWHSPYPVILSICISLSLPILAKLHKFPHHSTNCGWILIEHFTFALNAIAEGSLHLAKIRSGAAATSPNLTTNSMRVPGELQDVWTKKTRHMKGIAVQTMTSSSARTSSSTPSSNARGRCRRSPKRPSTSSSR